MSPIKKPRVKSVARYFSIQDFLAEERALDELRGRLNALWSFTESQRGDLWKRRLAETALAAAVVLRQSAPPEEGKRLSDAIGHCKKILPPHLAEEKPVPSWGARVDVQTTIRADLLSMVSPRAAGRLARAKEILEKRHQRRAEKRLQEKRTQLMEHVNRFIELEQIGG